MIMTQEAVEQLQEGRSYYYGTGRRKTAVARVRVYPGSGDITVNGKPFLEVFTRISYQIKVRQPMKVVDMVDQFDVRAKVEGGGVTAWADAIAHGTARALEAFNPALKPALRKAGLITRDPRVKERKKYGLKRARKAPQYTKR